MSCQLADLAPEPEGGQLYRPAGYESLPKILGGAICRSKYPRKRRGGEILELEQPGHEQDRRLRCLSSGLLENWAAELRSSHQYVLERHGRFSKHAMSTQENTHIYTHTRTHTHTAIEAGPRAAKSKNHQRLKTAACS